MTTITRGDESRKFYTVPVGKCNQLTTLEKSKYDNEPLKVFLHVEEKTKLSKKGPSKKSAKKPKSALIVTGEYISKKEPSKISEKKPN